VKAEFEKQCDLGTMKKVSYGWAPERYDDLLIAPLAMIQEGEDSFRILHDGTHKVKVYNKIRLKDKEQTPTAADVEAAMQADDDVPLSYLAMAFDGLKAHRRIPTDEKDWGLQACAVEEPPDGAIEEWPIYLNCVGTYGIGSASYWWAKFSPLLHRITLALCRPGLMWLFRFADDFMMPSRGRELWAPLLRVLLLTEIFKVPLKRSNTQGAVASGRSRHSAQELGWAPLGAQVRQRAEQTIRCS
jgi:hypothetical protein